MFLVFLFLFLLLCAEWIPALWLDVFNDLLYEDNQLDYEDQWTLNFSYSQTDTVTKDERKRGWKIYAHCARGKYVP